jgi:hypothetical protein
VELSTVLRVGAHVGNFVPGSKIVAYGNHGALIVASTGVSSKL